MNESANFLRKAVGRPASSMPAPPLLAVAIAALAGGAWLAATGRLRAGGVVLVAAGLVLAAAFNATPSGRWGRYVASVADSVADAAVIAALAWPIRLGEVRLGAAAVSAIGCVFLGAYAQVKAASLSYRAPAWPAGSPERLLVLAAGMLIPHALEVSLWLIAASGLAVTARTMNSVWRQAAKDSP